MERGIGMREITIGQEQSFESFPAEVKLGNELYYMVKEQETYRLLSRICPHAGGLVEVEDGEFVCPLHGWSFNLDTGACLNVPSMQMQGYAVVVRNGELIAVMEE
jgi:anthranilate 1,2-dioxygenase ferredoxin subunit